MKATESTLNNNAATIAPVVTVSVASLRSAATAAREKAKETRDNATAATDSLATYRADSERRLLGIEEGFSRLEKISKRDVASVRFDALGFLAIQCLRRDMVKEGKSEHDTLSACGRVEKLARDVAIGVAESQKASGKTALSKVTMKQVADKLATSLLPGALALHDFIGFLHWSAETPRLNKAADKAETEASQAEALATQAEANEAKAKEAEAVAIAEAEKAKADAEKAKADETPAAPRRASAAARRAEPVPA